MEYGGSRVFGAFLAYKHGASGFGFVFMGNARKRPGHAMRRLEPDAVYNIPPNSVLMIQAPILNSSAPKSTAGLGCNLQRRMKLGMYTAWGHTPVRTIAVLRMLPKA